MSGRSFPSRVVSPSSGITMRHAADLMDDYVFATDLTAASDISVIRAAGGTERVFYMGGTGAMSLFQDSQSDTGWTEEALGQLANGLSDLCGVQGANGNLFAFGIGANVAALDLYMSQRGTNGTWGGWAPVAPSDALPPFVYAAAIDAMVIAGKLTLFALLQPSPGHPGGPSGLWTIDVEAKPPTWTQVVATDQLWLAPCTVAGAGAGVLFANTNSDDPTCMDLCFMAAPFTAAPTVLAAKISFTDLAVGMSSGGTSVIAIADNGYQSGNRVIAALDCAAPQNGFSTLDTTITVVGLAVTDQGDTPMAVFARDSTNVLHVIERTATSQWMTPFDLQLKCTSMTPARDSQGNGELLVWLPGKGLHRMWRDPSGTAGGLGPWSQEPVQYDAINQQLSQQSTYATTLTFYDAQGAVMPNQVLNLRASEIVSVNVAGQVLVLGPDNDTACTTDAAGSIRFTAETGALRTPELSASVPGIMANGEDFHVTPNRNVQHRLAKISTDDLLKVIPPKYAGDVDQVQQAVQTAMKAVLPDGGLPRARVRGQGAHGHRTPLSLRPDMKPFRLEIRPDGVSFRTLTEAEATAALAIYADRPQYDVFGFFDFFEDVVEAIGNAVESGINFIGTYIVKPAIEGLKVALDFTIGAVRYVVNGVIELAEQAFEAVETVFNAVMAFFKDLYDLLAWLLSGAMKDIWATKAYFEKQLAGTVSQLSGLAAQGGRISATYFAAAEQAIESAFSQIEQQLTGVDLDKVLNASAPSATADAGETIMAIVDAADAVATWLNDKIGDTLFGLGINPSFPSGMVSAAIAMLKDALAAVTSAIKQAIDGFVSAMQKFASSSANLGQAALAGIVEAAKQAILLVLKVVDGLVQQFVQFMSANLSTGMAAILNAGVSSFLVSAIYNLINPNSHEDVTVGRLLCLVCAFPATILYKVIFGDVPFPQAEAGVSDGAPTLAGANVPMILSGLIYLLLWSWIDVACDIDPLNEVEASWKVAALIGIPLLANGLVYPQPPNPPPIDPEPYSLKFTSWILGFCAPALGFFYALESGFTKGPRSDIGGCSMLAFVGLVGFAINMRQIAVVPNLSGTDMAMLIGGPLSAMVKPLKFGGKNPYTLIPLVITDVASDLTVAIGRVVRGT